MSSGTKPLPEHIITKTNAPYRSRIKNIHATLTGSYLTSHGREGIVNSIKYSIQLVQAYRKANTKHNITGL